MGDSADQLRETAAVSSELGTQINTTAGDAQHEIGQALSALQSAREVIARSASGVSRLEAASGSIDTFVSAIQDLADMTNLLALNAAIEAARAGEHGRGFAVVADEVRQLAATSGAATLEGAAATNHAAVAELVRQVEATAGGAQDQAAASEEAAAGAQQSAASTEDVAATATRLRQKAARLTELVAAFTV